MVKTPNVLKAAARRLGLTKPIKTIVSPEYRQVARLAGELKRDMSGRGFDPVYRAHINGGDGYKKYLDLDYALEPAIKLFLRLGLHKSPPFRLLDIGCGPGYFLYVSKRHGHLVTGTDIEDTAIFNDLVHLLEIPRFTHRVEAFQPMPDFGGPFDLITAQAIVFDLHRTENVWRTPQWKFFLEDCQKHLCPRGRIFLHFNPATTQDFDFIPDDVADLLRSLPGGKLSKSKEFFTLALPT